MSATSNVRKRASETPPDDNHTARHLGFMTDRLLKTFNVEAECDCTFICDGERVHASRLVLSAASDYFAALLSGAFKEGGLEPINMPGVSNATLVLCLRYLYTGDGSELTTSNVVDVLYAADMYRIKELCEACCQTMRTTLSPSNGIAYLTAADAVPAGSDLADACLNFVADCLVGATAEGVHALEALSLGTMLKLCSALGVKLKGCAAPAIFFAAFMPALLQWAQAKLGCRPVFSDLCKRADALRHDEMVAAGAHVFSSEHTFVVTQGQLSATTTLSTASRRFEVDCFTLAQVLATNDRNAGSFGLYATAVARQKHPDWWPCILNWRAKCAGRKWHGLCAHMFFSMEHFYRRYGYGSSKFGKHSDLSSPPLGAGELEASDVRAELTTTMDFTSNSLASMCYAYAAFTPAAWGGCSDKKCLEGVLALNCLPVETEDAVLESLVEFCARADPVSPSLVSDSAPSLLQHVRWQYVTPELVLSTCRRAPFRTAPPVKEALAWLLGHGGKPSFASEMKRDCYSASVVDQRPIKTSAVAAWLLGGDLEIEKAAEDMARELLSLRASAAEAEERARGAEERLAAAEARAAEAQ